MGITLLDSRQRVVFLSGWVLVSLLLAQVSEAVGRRGSELTNHGGPFALWGLDISDAALSDETTSEAIEALNVYAKYGVSSITLAFQPRGTGRGVFGEDGSLQDLALGKRIQNLSRAAVDRWMVPVIRIFSSDPSARLESAAAYERALIQVARLFRRNSDIILNLGYVPHAENLARFVRVLRDNGCRALVGVDLDSSPNAALKRENAIAIARAVDLVFCQVHLDVSIPFVVSGLGKPVVLTASVEDKQNPGTLRSGIGEFVRTIAAKRGLFLVARIPSCLEGPAPRFDPGAEIARSDSGLARYLRQVSEAQLSLHGPIKETTIAPAVNILDPGEKEDGFVPLFDGRTLRGWTLLSDSWQSFSVEDGVIACDGTSPNTYLRTARRYSDFVLRLESRIEPGGNSGIFIHAPLWGRSSRIGFELQIEGRPSPQPRRDSAGAIYDVLAPKVDAMNPPGEWNTYEIMCRGPHVRVKINGQLVQDFSMDEVPKMRDRLREGVIGLQDHSDKVWFRKVRIKELP